MDFDSVIDSVMQFYSRLPYQTGLESWQLLAIALSVLLALVLLLGYLRKTRVKKVHVIQSANRSEIIGINLSGKTENRLPHREYRTRETTFEREEPEETKSWGQTTKDWRKLREKIRHLQHDISKHEKAEKHLKEQIKELVYTNEKLQAEMGRRDQVEGGSRKQINELVAATPDRKLEPSSEEGLSRESEDQLTEAQPSGESHENLLKQAENTRDLHHSIEEISQQKQKDPVPAIMRGETEEESAISIQDNQESEHTHPLLSEEAKTANEAISRTSDSTEHLAEKTLEEDFDEPDKAQRDHNVPLDIKELKAIADLAKRLQARGQQRQS